VRRRWCLLAGIASWAAGCVMGCAAGPERRPPIVAMLTDYGTSDAYAGILAGAILRTCPDATLVTITHEVPPFDIAEGSYLLGRAAAEFPRHAVFVAVVDPGVGTRRRSIVVRTRSGRLFVGPDNGLLTRVIRDEGLDRAWAITNPALLRPEGLSSTFHGRDVYGPIGGRLADGLEPDRVGPEIHDPVLLPRREAVRRPDRLEGAVAHVDRYGNLTTNIPADWLGGWPPVEAKPVTIEFDGQSLSAARARTYADVAQGQLLVLENAEGFLEIARNEASAAEQLGLRAGAAVTIRP
jgi:S-adenosylmethionine hydrolase